MDYLNFKINGTKCWQNFKNTTKRRFFFNISVIGSGPNRPKIWQTNKLEKCCSLFEIRGTLALSCSIKRIIYIKRPRLTRNFLKFW